ncbi:MAG: alcohol dehydrogenase [Desulfobacteraceae bacterium]|nr:MAG: alcohol dehydrogenase [Desulfobacteraceae bacterium]
MKAIQLRADAARFALLQVLRPLSIRLCYSGPFSSVVLTDIPEPELPSQEWVKIRTRLCGFCASDLNLILMKDSPTAMPFTSFPCVPGHELCGEIAEAGRDAEGWKAGDRVVVSPQLNCEPRGIKPVCRSCARGMAPNCENFAEGRLAPGMFTGICREINGGFAPYLVAHRSQLFRVPPEVSWEAAVLTEPLAVSLQAVLANMPDAKDKVLVIGCGVIGLLVVRAIRALKIDCHITVAEPSSFAAEHASQSGADAVVPGNPIDAAVTLAGGRAYKPAIGERVVMGGFNRIYDTVGSGKTLFAAMRALAAGGVLSVLGIGKNVKLDLTPLWLKLQTIKGCYAYGTVATADGPKPVFGMALEMIASGKVRTADMLTHQFAIEDYRKMIEVNLFKSRYRAMKTAISFNH